MEWTRCNKKWKDFKPEPGMQVEIQPETPEGEATPTIARHLIGDVNIQGGLCDDCPGINREDTVLRYRQIELPKD